MKIMKCFTFVLACWLAMSAQVLAGDLEDGKKDRKGFFIGFGVGGGAYHQRSSGAKTTKGAGLFDFKIGGGLNEKILLMYAGSSSYTRINGVDVNVDNTPFAVQWFVWDNLYVRPAVGFAFSTSSVSNNGTTVSTDSKISVGADFAVGYEFRLCKRFALSPEAVYRYAHIRQDASAHAHIFGAQASLLWYF